MHYWNQTNFEGLAAIAEELAADPRLAGLADYCRHREAGLRKNAFEALGRFIESAQALPIGEKRNLVHSIYGLALRLPEAHQFLSTPLQVGFLHPVLDDWLLEQPADLEALRWDGIFRDREESLAKLLELDPDDEFARRQLIRRACLDRVDFALHHIHESKLLWEVSEIEALLAKGEGWLRGAPEKSDMQDLADQHAYYCALVSDWHAFVNSGTESFPHWCEKNGRSYRWTATYYYDD